MKTMKKITLVSVVLLVLLVLSLTAMIANATVRKTGSQGDYSPLTFHFADGDVPALVDVASINVLFDPPGLSYNQKEYFIAKGTPWKHHDIQGLDAPEKEFTSGEPFRLEMDLFFDRYEEGKSVREFTDKIEKLVLTDGDGKAVEPPDCIITWENKTYTCEVEKTETRLTLFLDDGTPVQAIMHIVFEEFVPVADQGRSDGAHKRPGPA